MSGLGVPNQAFFALQDNMLQQLANMLIRESLAVDALSQVNRDITGDQLRVFVDTMCHIMLYRRNDAKIINLASR